MRWLEAVALATAVELLVLGSLFGVEGLGGSWNGWLDLPSAFAPVWLACSALGALFLWPLTKQPWERVATLALAFVGIVSSVTLLWPEFTGSKTPVAGGSSAHQLRLLTFNVWDENIDPEGTVAMILAARADVVALQEKAGIPPAVRAKLRGAYPFVLDCQPGCDLVLLSKRPWRQTSRPSSWASGFESLGGETAGADGTPVQLLTTHMSWPIPPGPQARQRQILAQTVAHLDRPDLIVAGDFNLAPWTAALKALDLAMTPLTRVTRALPTWPANIARLERPFPFPILPIDHIYAGPAWRPLSVQRLVAAGRTTTRSWRRLFMPEAGRARRAVGSGLPAWTWRL